LLAGLQASHDLGVASLDDSHLDVDVPPIRSVDDLDVATLPGRPDGALRYEYYV
jgi:hypothetical protein